MPRDASGTYTLPTAPFQPLTLAKSADMNTALDDIADALTDSQSRAAPTPAQGDLNLNGHNVTNLGEVVGDLYTTGNVNVGGNAVTIGANTTQYPELVLNGAAGTDREITCETAGKIRWRIIPGDGVAETGSNAGSNFEIIRHADDGSTVLGAPLTISRATGQVTLAQALTANGGISTTTIAASGNLSCAGLTTSGTIISGTINSGALTASGIVTASAANINSNINAGSLAVTGTATIGGNITAATANVTGTLTATTANVTGTLTATTANVTGNVGVTGTLNANSANFGPTSVNGSLYVLNNEVHAGNRGIYYTGIDNDTHAVAFAWASTQMNMYVDKTYVGHILTGALQREEGAPAIDEVVAGLEARIAALEAKVAGG